MGQKVNPNGIRLGITTNWNSNWYAGKKQYAECLGKDLKVREFLLDKLKSAGVTRIEIERRAQNVKVSIHSARPGMIIGKKGTDAESLRKEVAKIVQVPVDVNIQEVRKPDLNSKLVAESIAQQLERRVMFRRAIKRAIQSAMRAGAKGIKVSLSGRLAGAEIARTEWAREGRVPLHTFRADIDYNTAIASTTYGIIGVKVWIFKGEIHAKDLNNKSAAAEVVGTGE